MREKKGIEDKGKVDGIPVDKESVSRALEEKGALVVGSAKKARVLIRLAAKELGIDAHHPLVEPLEPRELGKVLEEEGRELKPFSTHVEPERPPSFLLLRLRRYQETEALLGC